MLRQTGAAAMDLVQFHVWQDAWADDAGWQREIEALTREGLVRHWGISVNRREPANVVRTLRTGLIDAVQVVYNVFDQAPEDELFPACRELGVAVIARVPLDEGSLAGELTRDPDGRMGIGGTRTSRRRTCAETVARVEALRPLVPEGETMAQLALRFVLSNPDVTTVIPGMRSPEHLAVERGRRGERARCRTTWSRRCARTAGTGRRRGHRSRSSRPGTCRTTRRVAAWAAAVRSAAVRAAAWAAVWAAPTHTAESRAAPDTPRSRATGPLSAG